MFTIAFISGLAERAIKTFAQSLLAVIGVTGLGFGDVDWALALSAAGLAALASVLTSVVSPSFTAGVTAAPGKHEAGPLDVSGHTSIPGTTLDLGATEADPERYRGE